MRDRTRDEVETVTPIENLVAKATHYEAFDRVRVAGLCFDCATKFGFAATDKTKAAPTLCLKCVKRGVGSHLV
jgi:hypothetical protein